MWDNDDRLGPQHADAVRVTAVRECCKGCEARVLHEIAIGAGWSAFAAPPLRRDSLRRVVDTQKTWPALRAGLAVARATRERKLAGSTGLEPATSGVTGRRSNQLNYDPAVVWRSSDG
jgi:hypothetical protein